MLRLLVVAALVYSPIVLARDAMAVQTSGTIAGSVHDATTGEPIPFAILEIDPEHRTVADSAGRFVFEDVPAGAYALTIRRTGYQARSVDGDLAARGFVSLTLALQPATVTLDPVTVEAEATGARRHLAGFEGRRRAGSGHHLTREEFEQWNPAQVTDLLRHVPSVRVRPNPRYGFDGDTRQFVVETRRGGETGHFQPEGPECPVLYFLDGIAVGDGRNTDIDYFLSVYQIDAVETYVGAQVPAMFQGPGSRCGVVAFWTRQMPADQRAGGPSVLSGLIGATAGVGFALLSPADCRRCLISTDDRLSRAMGNAVIFGLAGVAVSWLFFRSSDGTLFTVSPLGAGRYGVGATIGIGRVQ